MTASLFIYHFTNAVKFNAKIIAVGAPHASYFTQAFSYLHLHPQCLDPEGRALIPITAGILLCHDGLSESNR